MMVHLNESQQAILAELNKAYGAVVTRGQVMDHYKGNALPLCRWLLTDPAFRVGRGQYSTVIDSANTIVTPDPLPQSVDPTRPFPRFSRKQARLEEVAAEAARQREAVDSDIVSDDEPTRPVVSHLKPSKADLRKAPTIMVGEGNSASLVPEKNPVFVPFGNYTDVHKVIKSRIFYPIFLTGPSGGGKTMLAQQACANLKRELIRVQITPETDEDDLIGGFRLINGETVWFDGPVTIAAIRGAICLVDEIDYGTGKISCLQGILEGNGIFLKKVNRFVPLTPGFNIIATGNTKGRGSEEHGGRYINTQIMNEAFLERFGVTMEQEFPTKSTEEKILQNELTLVGKNTKPNMRFASNLVTWAEVVRQSFEAGAVEDVISTRRLVHIIRAFGVFDDPMQSLSMCLTRFDHQTRDAFIELYTKVCVPDSQRPLAEFDADGKPITEATVGVNLDPDVAGKL